jgi:hypothetical protein
MKHGIRRAILWLLLSSLIPQPSSLARADGGALRLSERAGDYQVAVFTTPTPVRAGAVDVSVLVLKADTQEPVPGVRVTIEAEGPGTVVRQPATAGAATNKLFHAADFDLTEPGRYSLAVFIDGPLGRAEAHAEVEVGEPLPPFLALWPWVAWPALPVLLFAIHQLLARPAQKGRREAVREGRSCGSVRPFAVLQDRRQASGPFPDQLPRK